MNNIKDVAEFIGKIAEKIHGINPYKITKEEYDNHDHKEEGCQGCAGWFEQNPKEERCPNDDGSNLPPSHTSCSLCNSLKEEYLSASESRMERSDEVSRENAEAVN